MIPSNHFEGEKEMYMLRSRSGTNDTYFPADRCTFRTTYNNGNYVVSTNPAPTFYNGNNNGTPISGANTAATRAILGYISKTGRFVDMTTE